MAGKTEVYRVVFNDGLNDDGTQSNHNALVFQEPTEGKVYKNGQMIVFGDEGQSSFAQTNDDGEIPQMEPTGVEGENLGISWHWAK